jgi:hypothetical protein
MRERATSMPGQVTRSSSTATRLERDGEGDFLLDPELLAERFALSAERFRRLVQAGHVRSSVERGTGEDEGRQRLTVRCGNRAWTAVVDAGGNIVSESFTVLRNPPAR